MDSRVVIVTGGTIGIGRSTALAFARSGFKVVIAARNEAPAHEVIATIEESGGECLFVQTDVSKSADVERLTDATLEKFGRLDCAINNAAVETQRPFLEWSEEEWDELIDINLKGVWLCMKYQIPHMLNRNGSIVNISSVAGLIGVPLHAPYIASKHGVLGLTKAASIEYADQGLRVNAICPGVIRTPMLENAMRLTAEVADQATAATPMGRIGEPREVADTARWLCSDAASFITGITVSVDGGWSQH